MEYQKHYEEVISVPASPEAVFDFANDPMNFSSHMNKGQAMMMGSKMETVVDEKGGKEIGSHIKMTGNMIGANLFLDEVVTKLEPPFHKEWQTVGDINLIVIDRYTLGFDIKKTSQGSAFKVFIDYDFPKSPKTRLIGKLFGEIYAKWCVRQMAGGIEEHFK